MYNVLTFDIGNTWLVLASIENFDTVHVWKKLEQSISEHYNFAEKEQKKQYDDNLEWFQTIDIRYFLNRIIDTDNGYYYLITQNSDTIINTSIMLKTYQHDTKKYINILDVFEDAEWYVQNAIECVDIEGECYEISGLCN